MCGIAGIAAGPGAVLPTRDTLHRMCNTIIHRGPDDEGIGIEGRVALGMRRLSIIDVAGGRQPLLNEESNVRAIFNGEIYNYREGGGGAVRLQGPGGWGATAIDRLAALNRA